MGNPTFVVVTDRNDLDDQLFGQFGRCAKFLRQVPVQALHRDKGKGNLKDLLSGREANGIVFTTMQKFSEGDGPLSERHNIIVMVDEAHRGQYGLTEEIKPDGTISIGAAKLVRDALPNASYIGFTGTPIALDGRNTREVFGDYIDVYDMTQAVEDEATVPVYYESRVVALNLDADALESLDAAYREFSDEHDEETTQRSKHLMSGLDGILGAPRRWPTSAATSSPTTRENRAGLLAGKAMIVAYSRPIAMKIYYELMRLRPEWSDKVGVGHDHEQPGPEEWFDIVGGRSIRRRWSDDSRATTTRSRSPSSWTCGSRASMYPSLATMYMYKPMKGHNLMQAIARSTACTLARRAAYRRLYRHCECAQVCHEVLHEPRPQELRGHGRRQDGLP